MTRPPHSADETPPEGRELAYAYCIHRAVTALFGATYGRGKHGQPSTWRKHGAKIAEFFDMRLEDVDRIVRTTTRRRNRMKAELDQIRRRGKRKTKKAVLRLPSRINDRD